MARDTTIRTATLEDVPSIARVHVQSWRETYTGIVPQPYLDGLTEASRAQIHTRALEAGNAILVAEAGGEIIGFTSGGTSRDGGFDGEVFTLYLLKSAHGSGTGKALFMAMLRTLEKRGLTSVIVWVLADNPTCGFYARMGGVQTLEQHLEIAGKKLLEYGYAFALPLAGA